VIVATTSQPAYAAFSARPQANDQGPQLRRFPRLFWDVLTRTCLRQARDDALRRYLASLPSGPPEEPPALGSSSSTRNSEGRGQISAAVETDEEARELALHVAQLLEEPLRGRLDKFLLWPDEGAAVKPFYRFLVELAAEQQLPAAAASILLASQGTASREKYARCVAVATWPPAWLNEHSSSSSSSSSRHVLWVAAADRLLPPVALSEAAYSKDQGHLWAAYSEDQGLLWAAWTEGQGAGDVASSSMTVEAQVGNGPR